MNNIFENIPKLHGRKERILEANKIIYNKLAEEDAELASYYWNYVLVPTHNLIDLGDTNLYKEET